MIEDISLRVIEEGKYIIKENTTIRKCASHFGISKSTVHNDISIKLKELNPRLYSKVRIVIENNKKVRHIRGGLATKEKYKRLLNEKEKKEKQEKQEAYI